MGAPQEKRGHLATAEKLLRKLDAVEGVSAAALGAERFAVTLARTGLPRGADGRATEARVREVLGALDAAVEGGRPAVDRGAVAHARDHGHGQRRRQLGGGGGPGVDLDTADPIAAVVVALAMAQRVGHPRGGVRAAGRR